MQFKKWAEDLIDSPKKTYRWPSGICKDAQNYKSSVQFRSVTQSCPTLSDPMDYSIPGFPVHHQLPDPTQTHAH